MATTSIDNFTVADYNFQQTAGVQFPTSAILTLVPDHGYAIDFADFAFQAPIPPSINSAASYFQQNGVNVELVAIFINPGLMPTNDLEIPICVQGFSKLITISLAGTFSGTVTNVPAFANVTYAASGDFGSTQTILSKTFAANSGFYFDTLPTATISTGSLHDYAITNTTASDANSNIISSTFSIAYTFPIGNVTGDDIKFIANAIQIFVPTVFINAYTVSRAPLNALGATRELVLYGDPGAAYAFVIAKSNGTSISSGSGVIGASGVFTTSTVFPASSVAETYTYTLTGDLNPANICASCALPATFTVLQLMDITLSFNVTSTNNNIVVGSGATNSLILTPNQNYNGTSYDVELSLQPATGYILSVDAGASLSMANFLPSTAQDGDVNGGTYFSASISNSNLSAAPNGDWLLSFTYILNNTGTLSVSNTLNSDLFVSASAAATPFAYKRSLLSYASSSLACASTLDTTLNIYFLNNNIASGVTVFQDAALTQIFIGNGNFYKIGTAAASQSAQINSLGTIINNITTC